MPKKKRKVELLDEKAAPTIPFDPEADSRGFPSTVSVAGGGLLYYHGTAPITGDALYRGIDSKGELRHAIVCNPEAFAHQASHLNRGG